MSCAVVKQSPDASARPHLRQLDNLVRLHETKVKGLSRRLTKAEASVAELTKEVQELTERNRALNTMRVKDALMRAMTGGSAR
jgi:hypothetical protein